MKLISYNGRVFVTDGLVKRYVPSTKVMGDLLKITGQTTSIGVSKDTHDWLVDDVPGSALALAIGNCDARVENLTRIVIDHVQSGA